MENSERKKLRIFSLQFQQNYIRKKDITVNVTLQLQRAETTQASDFRKSILRRVKRKRNSKNKKRRNKKLISDNTDKKMRGFLCLFVILLLVTFPHATSSHTGGVNGIPGIISLREIAETGEEKQSFQKYVVCGQGSTTQISQF